MYLSANLHCHQRSLSNRACCHSAVLCRAVGSELQSAMWLACWCLMRPACVWQVIHTLHSLHIPTTCAAHHTRCTDVSLSRRILLWYCGAASGVLNAAGAAHLTALLDTASHLAQPNNNQQPPVVQINTATQSHQHTHTGSIRNSTALFPFQRLIDPLLPSPPYGLCCLPANICSAAPTHMTRQLRAHCEQKGECSSVMSCSHNTERCISLVRINSSLTCR